MTLTSHTDFAAFLEAVQQCRGEVLFCTREGDKLNLKSTLSKYLFAALAEPQIQQPTCGLAERGADALGHGAHLGRQAGGHAVHPAAECCQRHPARLIQPNAPQPRRTGGL